MFVKLPAGPRLGFRGMLAPFQDSGFIPLKGVASVPIGSTVDTRKGEIEHASPRPTATPPATGARAASRRGSGRHVRDQAEAREGRASAARPSIAIDVDLLSPPGPRPRASSGPAKGIVRTMSMVVKGYYRALGGASTATARNATFDTTDRCDGTLTEVGKGRVSLKRQGPKKPVVVRAGRAYLVKAKLFQVRKGRRPAEGRRG